MKNNSASVGLGLCSKLWFSTNTKSLQIMAYFGTVAIASYALGALIGLAFGLG